MDIFEQFRTPKRIGPPHLKIAEIFTTDIRSEDMQKSEQEPKMGFPHIRDWE